MFQTGEETRLSFANVGIAFCFLAVAFLLSFIFKLKLETSIVISAARCYIQLSLLGVVLHHILQSDNPYLVGLMAG
jgi:ABC-type iron transport system FetAB permease component